MYAVVAGIIATAKINGKWLDYIPVSDIQILNMVRKLERDMASYPHAQPDEVYGTRATDAVVQLRNVDYLLKQLDTGLHAGRIKSPGYGTSTGF